MQWTGDLDCVDAIESFLDSRRRPKEPNPEDDVFVGNVRDESKMIGWRKLKNGITMDSGSAVDELDIRQQRTAAAAEAGVAEAPDDASVCEAAEASRGKADRLSAVGDHLVHIKRRLGIGLIWQKENRSLVPKEVLL